MTATKNDSTRASSTPSAPQPSPKPFPLFPVAGIIVALVLVGIFVSGGSFSGLTGLVTGSPAKIATTDTTPTVVDNSTSSLIDGLSPAERAGALKAVLSKAAYQKAVYEVNRDTYHLFEKAAAYRHETLDQTKAFFYNCCGLKSEEDIFAQLPPVPSDFAERMFALQTGRDFQIGLLDEGYYKQPEAYFHGETTAAINQSLAFRPWLETDLTQWGEYGFAVTPAEQSTTISKSKDNHFTAAVFASNGWNVQNYVGINLVPDNKSNELFDLTISDDATGKPYFLLGPTFPVFNRDWATKITITGSAKPGTPPGVYAIGINPITPPKQLEEKWSYDHVGLYSSYGGIGPSGNYLTLFITVTE